VIDLYGETGKFDVIAITDHILMKKDLLARLGRLATLGRRNFGVREEHFDAYLADIRAEARRAMKRCDFHKPKHLYSWKTLLRCEKNWPAIKRALRGNVDIALTLFRNGEWATE
jgi:hypothetical protein